MKTRDKFDMRNFSNFILIIYFFLLQNQKQAIWGSNRIIDCSIMNELNYSNWKEIEGAIWLNLPMHSI